MPDAFIKERLYFIIEHIEAISEYFSIIHHPSDFKSSFEGKKSFDAIAGKLLAIGEGIKRSNKSSPDSLKKI